MNEKGLVQDGETILEKVKGDFTEIANLTDRLRLEVGRLNASTQRISRILDGLCKGDVEC